MKRLQTDTLVLVAAIILDERRLWNIVLETAQETLAMAIAVTNAFDGQMSLCGARASCRLDKFQSNRSARRPECSHQGAIEPASQCALSSNYMAKVTARGQVLVASLPGVVSITIMLVAVVYELIQQCALRILKIGTAGRRSS